MLQKSTIFTTDKRTNDLRLMKKVKSFIPVNEWFEEKLVKPLIISGPCSAESFKQLDLTALALSKIACVKVFRAGIWKPRTRPGTFEGVGITGLKWLKEIKEKYNFKTAVEVAHPDHVEKCLEYSVDIIWIGARTTSNPFSVQEIASSLKGCDIPVMIKNPLNPDMELWCGAIERVYSSGIRRMAAIHRGFYPFEKTSLRNIPKWEIVIDLKSCFHELPVICDPSHISGSRKYIEEISQKAMDLNFDGLMIESHFDPKQAKSDADQQLKPSDLAKLLKKLTFRQSDSHNIEFRNLLEQYRDQIDSIDIQLIELLATRMNVVREIGKYKKEHNVTILDLRRWEDIIRTRMELGKKLKLSDDFVENLLKLVHKASIQKQEEVMQKKSNH